MRNFTSKLYFTLRKQESVKVPEGDSLTFWGKPPYTRLAKQLEEEDKLYMVPSLRPSECSSVTLSPPPCLRSHQNI